MIMLKSSAAGMFFEQSYLECIHIQFANLTRVTVNTPNNNVECAGIDIILNIDSDCEDLFIMMTLPYRY